MRNGEWVHEVDVTFIIQSDSNFEIAKNYVFFLFVLGNLYIVMEVSVFTTYIVYLKKMLKELDFKVLSNFELVYWTISE